MERETKEHIRGLSDIELLEYKKMDTYLPEALEFAQQELRRRNLSPEQLSALEHELSQEFQQLEKIAHAPLSNFSRVSVFICGLFFGMPFIIFIPLMLRFAEEGARLKQKELWFIGLLGLVLGLVATVLRIPPWSWFRE